MEDSKAYSVTYSLKLRVFLSQQSQCSIFYILLPLPMNYQFNSKLASAFYTFNIGIT